MAINKQLKHINHQLISNRLKLSLTKGRIVKNITIIGSIQEEPIIFGYLANSSNRGKRPKMSQRPYLRAFCKARKSHF